MLLCLAVDGVIAQERGRAAATPDASDLNEDGQLRKLPSLPRGMTLELIRQGDAVYRGKGGCVTCHGADGGGVSGPALTSVLETWPDYRDHMAWVRLGSSGWPGTVYGDAQKPIGAGGMPAFADLSDQELAAVVLYERSSFGGLAEGDQEYTDLEAVANAMRVVPWSTAFEGMEQVEGLDVPTLVVGSRDAADGLHPFDVAEDYAERMPNAELLVEDEEQSPIAWQGARLSRAIEDFLSRNGIE
jgi:mono/diheme cytochrome c family protein